MMKILITSLLFIIAASVCAEDDRQFKIIDSLIKSDLDSLTHYEKEYKTGRGKWDILDSLRKLRKYREILDSIKVYSENDTDAYLKWARFDVYLLLGDWPFIY